MEGGVETLSYFSHQMAGEFQKLGYAVFFYDLKQEESSAGKLRKFIRPRETVLVTFNFQGLEKEAGVYREGIGYLWDTYHIPCYNIAADHPYFYDDRLKDLPEKYRHISIDRRQKAYFEEFSSQAESNIDSLLNVDTIQKVQSIINSLSVQLFGVLGVVKNIFLGLLISAYLLGSRKLFGAQAGLILHGVFSDKWAKIIEEEIRYTDKMFNGFLVGKIIDSAIIGLLCFAGTSIMGFEAPAFISVIIGITNIIPFFGPFIGAIPCGLLLLLENPMHCLYFIIFIFVLQQLDGNVIGPKILGNTTGVSSFWVLFAILLFGGMWGVVGMVIGVPLFAVIYDIIRKLVYRGLRKHKRESMITDYEEKYHKS
mgnify:CR=1 FL=1